NQIINANRGINVTANSGVGVYSSNNVSNLTFNGTITGSANLTKVGGATWDNNSENATTYSGNWDVQDGALGDVSPTAVRPVGTGSMSLTGGGLAIKPNGTNPAVLVDVAPGLSTLTYGSNAHLFVN